MVSFPNWHSTRMPIADHGPMSKHAKLLGQTTGERERHGDRERRTEGKKKNKKKKDRGRYAAIEESPRSVGEAYHPSNTAQ